MPNPNGSEIDYIDILHKTSNKDKKIASNIIDSIDESKTTIKTAIVIKEIMKQLEEQRGKKEDLEGLAKPSPNAQGNKQKKPSKKDIDNYFNKLKDEISKKKTEKTLEQDQPSESGMGSDKGQQDSVWSPPSINKEGVQNPFDTERNKNKQEGRGGAGGTGGAGGAGGGSSGSGGSGGTGAGMSGSSATGSGSTSKGQDTGGGGTSSGGMGGSGSESWGKEDWGEEETPIGSGNWGNDGGEDSQDHNGGMDKGKEGVWRGGSKGYGYTGGDTPEKVEHTVEWNPFSNLEIDEEDEDFWDEDESLASETSTVEEMNDFIDESVRTASELEDVIRDAYDKTREMTSGLKDVWMNKIENATSDEISVDKVMTMEDLETLADDKNSQLRSIFMRELAVAMDEATEGKVFTKRGGETPRGIDWKKTLKTLAKDNPYKYSKIPVKDTYYTKDVNHLIIDVSGSMTSWIPTLAVLAGMLADVEDDPSIVHIHYFGDRFCVESTDQYLGKDGETVEVKDPLKRVLIDVKEGKALSIASASGNDYALILKETYTDLRAENKPEKILKDIKKYLGDVMKYSLTTAEYPTIVQEDEYSNLVEEILLETPPEKTANRKYQTPWCLSVEDVNKDTTVTIMGDHIDIRIDNSRDRETMLQQYAKLAEKAKKLVIVNVNKTTSEWRLFKKELLSTIPPEKLTICEPDKEGKISALKFAKCVLS